MATGNHYRRSRGRAALFLLSLSSMLYTGCSSTPVPPDPNTVKGRFHQLFIGMSKDKALKIVGKPDSNKTLDIEDIYYYNDEHKVYYMKILHSEVVEFGVESTYEQF